MSLEKIKSEGGHAKGHSNMAHRAETALIKKGAKKKRRALDKKLSKEKE